MDSSMTIRWNGGRASDTTNGRAWGAATGVAIAAVAVAGSLVLDAALGATSMDRVAHAMIASLGALVLVARARIRFAREAHPLGIDAAFSAGIRVIDADDSVGAALEDADHAMYPDEHAAAQPARALAPRRARRWVSFGAGLLAASLGLAHASAQDVMEDRAALIVDKPLPPPPPAPFPVRVELLGGTLAPIDIDLAARLVVLDRVIVGVAAGLTTYGGVAGQIVDQNGGNGAGETVSTMSLGAFTFRAYGGVRPFEGLGLELVGGYAMITQQADVDVGGIARLFGVQTSATSGHAGFTLHAATVELAWTFFVLDHFVIRPAIGYLQVLDADVALSSTATTAGLDDASRALEGAIQHYGMTPTLSLMLGYRF